MTDPSGTSSILFINLSGRTFDDLASVVGATSIRNWSPSNPNDGLWSGVDVVVMATSSAEALSTEDLSTLTRAAPSARLILIGPTSKSAVELMIKLNSKIQVVDWLPDSLDTATTLEATILKALSESQELRQAQESLHLYLEHNESLQRLSIELENRIEARRKELVESTWKLQQSQKRNDVLHRSLSAVHLSQSVGEIESRLGRVLQMPSDAPHVDWVKVAFQNLSNIEQGKFDSRSAAVFAVPIRNGGTLYFGRSAEKPFRSEDRSFLTPIAEAVSLAVSRTQTLERMNQVKREWEETFNSISDPIAVIDENLNIVRGNRALLKDSRPETIVGRPCYEIVFRRESACEGCPLQKTKATNRGRVPEGLAPSTFRVQSSDEYEVSSRPIESGLLVHLYRNDAQAARFEKRITESAKMAELGTIGSSIAHQLNNPIGGMLSLIQLLLMDIDGKPEAFEGAHELRDELRAMEAGTRRCANIVKDLLGFTRRGVEDAPGEHDLHDVVQQAVKITELQTRTQGIIFKIENAAKPHDSDLSQALDEPILVIGRFNLLAQAIRAVLLGMIGVLKSESREKVITLKMISPLDQGRVGKDALSAVLIIHCDAPTSVDSTPALPDLTIAREIMDEHGGSLDYELKKESGPGKNRPVQEARFRLQAKSLTTKI